MTVRMMGLEMTGGSMLCLGIMFILSGVMFFYMKKQLTHLEDAQLEQAKLLQSMIMSLNSGAMGMGPGAIGQDAMGPGAMGQDAMGMGPGAMGPGAMGMGQDANNDNLIDVSDGEDDDSDEESDNEDGNSDEESDDEDGNSDEDVDSDDENDVDSEEENDDEDDDSDDEDDDIDDESASMVNVKINNHNIDHYEFNNLPQKETNMNDIDEDSIIEIKESVKVINIKNNAFMGEPEEIDMDNDLTSMTDTNMDDDDDDTLTVNSSLSGMNLAKSSLKALKVGDLRKMVIDRGLHSDPSKIKKAELIELLQKQ